MIESSDIQEVSAIVSFHTNQTCGEPCWHAREDICRCYCGGRNHGCLKTADGIAPTRMAKIDGYMYRLKAFGNYRELYSQAKGMNESGKPATTAGGYNGDRTYYYRETDKGAWARLKPPSYEQTQRWSEYKQFHGLDRRGIFQANDCHDLYALWERVQ